MTCDVAVHVGRESVAEQHGGKAAVVTQWQRNQAADEGSHETCDRKKVGDPLPQGVRLEAERERVRARSKTRCGSFARKKGHERQRDAYLTLHKQNRVGERERSRSGSRARKGGMSGHAMRTRPCTSKTVRASENGLAVVLVLGKGA